MLAYDKTRNPAVAPNKTRVVFRFASGTCEAAKSKQFFRLGPTSSGLSLKPLNTAVKN